MHFGLLNNIFNFFIIVRASAVRGSFFIDRGRSDHSTCQLPLQSRRHTYLPINYNKNEKYYNERLTTNLVPRFGLFLRVYSIVLLMDERTR